MRILPVMRCKAIDDCVPGELVRCRWSGSYRWAICGKLQDSRHVLVALPDGEGAWPEYGCSQSTQVVAYGIDYELHVDQSGTVELPANNLSEIAGCLLLHEARWLMRVAASQGFGHHPYWFDLAEGSLVGEPELSKSAAFGGWAIQLRTDAALGGQTEKIARFKWEKRTKT